MQLERIVALKGLGLSLQQIAVLTKDEARAARLLKQQRALLDDKRRRLERAVRAIDAIADDRMPGAALDRFVNESSWDRWEMRRKAAGRVRAARTRSREPSRVALFPENSRRAGSEPARAGRRASSSANGTRSSSANPAATRTCRSRNGSDGRAGETGLPACGITSRPFTTWNGPPGNASRRSSIR